MTQDESLAAREESSIRASLEEMTSGQVEFAQPQVIIDTVEKLWSSGPSGPLGVRERVAHYRATTSGWTIGLSTEFVKSTQNIDRKLQGRILQAITQISTEPTTPQGNTVKPLTSSFKGLWRYRIGDFRLVYHPDNTTRQVTLLAFAGRGSVYG